MFRNSRHHTDTAGEFSARDAFAARRQRAGREGRGAADAPTPEWANPDGTVDVSKMPERCR